MTGAPSRREASAAQTRRELLATASKLFAEHPYAAVSGATIASEAGLTRGAIQHHFGSKDGLFAEVFRVHQEGVAARIVDAVALHQDPWQQAQAGLAAFLDACAEPAYMNVVLVAGPTALGWERWRELDAAYFGTMVDAVIALLSHHGLADHPAALLSATIRGAVTELSLEVAGADDPATCRADALAVIHTVVEAFRIPATGDASTQEPEAAGS